MPSATQYQLSLDDDPAFGSPTNVFTGATSYTFTNLAGGTWYAQVRVTAAGSCNVPSPWSSPVSVSQFCGSPIVGRVFDDPSLSAVLVGGMCELAGAFGVQPGAGSSVTVNPGGYSDLVDPAGNFTIADVPAGVGYTARLTPTGDWVCTCPTNCVYSVNSPPAASLRYYVSQLQTAWAQTVGGDVHAQGGITNPIPSTCATPGCTPQFSLAGTNAVGVVTATGGRTYGSGAVSATGWEGTSRYDGPQFRFDFWRREATIDRTLANCDLNNSPVPGLGPVFEVSCNSDFALTGNWNNIPQPMTIFVNFDSPTRTLTLNPANPGIVINPAGLLTIITNGNIQVADTVTRVEGIYLIDGEFRTCSSPTCGYDSGTGTSYQLNLRGSMIGWGGVDLRRDLNINNNNTPAELFTYEPAFIEDLPPFLYRSLYTWEEVAP